MRARVYAYESVYPCTQYLLYACTHACMYVCIYICMYVCMYVSTCVCINAHSQHKHTVALFAVHGDEHVPLAQ